MKLRGRRVLFVCLILCIIAVSARLFAFPLNVQVDKSLSGVLYYGRADELGGRDSASEQVKVIINGTYKKYFFRHNVFEGEIIVKGGELYVSLPYSSHSQLIFEGETWAPIYGSDEKWFGMLSASDDFSLISINLNDPLYGEEFFVGAPAETEADARKIIGKILDTR
jgi:hypothetical protein